MLIIKNSNQRDNIFLAEYSHENVDIILENYNKNKSTKNLSNEFWVNAYAFC